MLRPPRGLGGALSLPPPLTFPPQEEDVGAQASGEFEVFVEGKLVHSKKVILSKGFGRGGRVVPGPWRWGTLTSVFLPSVPRKAMALWMRPGCGKS